MYKCSMCELESIVCLKCNLKMSTKDRENERYKWIKFIKTIKDKNNDDVPNKITLLNYIIDTMERGEINGR